MPIPGNYGEVMPPPRANFNNMTQNTYPYNSMAQVQQQNLQNRSSAGGTLQQYFRQVTPVNGYIVNDVSEIMPKDVPMDGTVCLFPTHDYSCIWAKMWNKDGQLLTFKFVEEIPTPPAVNENNSDNGYLNDIMLKLDNMQTALDAISSSFDITPTSTKTKSKATKEETK